MRDPFQNTRKRRRSIRLIDIDAWIDSSLFRAGRSVAGKFEAFSLFMRRFRVTGWKRGVVEVLGDGLTLGAGGMVLMLALALPAFEATRTDWRAQGRLFGHLPRPLRQRDRQARHQPATIRCRSTRCPTI